MFGLPVYRHLIQGSAIRTWNCVTHIANSIWYKLYPAKPLIMPRSRRRYHSRSRSRSRSPSHDRDRDAKRRKIEGYDDSSESEAIETIDRKTEDTQNEQLKTDCDMDISDVPAETLINEECNNDSEESSKNSDKSSNADEEDLKVAVETELESTETNQEPKLKTTTGTDESTEVDAPKDSAHSEPENVTETESPKSSVDGNVSQDDVTANNINLDDSIVELDVNTSVNIAANVTPSKPLTQKQLQKRLESEKKKIEKQKERDDRERQKNLERQKEREERERQKNLEREEREKKRQQERDEKNQIRIRQKEEKDKEKLEKQKELESIQKEKEQKRKEKEEQEEQKRLRKQQEIDEKNKEKQKVLDQKQKTAAMFVNFFKKKKTDVTTTPVVEDKKIEEQQNYFMPFEVKSDMRLAPTQRRELSNKDKEILQDALSQQLHDKLYLDDLKSGKLIGAEGKTWPYSEDDIMVVDDLGESIEEPKMQKMRAKFLKFDENQRPAYYGTWRKRSATIKPRNPCQKDEKHLNYEVDSEDEWEEEGEGESLKGSDDEEEKEPESDQDYEVDNEFFVPHCYLSEDEVDDEATAKMNPELHKAKLKLLKNEFDKEMKSKTQRLKTRIFGCVWMDKDMTNENDPMVRHMQMFACLADELPVIIPKQTEYALEKPKASKNTATLDKEHMAEFLRCIHGSMRNKKVISKEFWQYLNDSDIVDIGKVNMASLRRLLVQVAQWCRCPEEGPFHNKYCWYVSEEMRKKYDVTLSLPNKWEYQSKTAETPADN